MEQFIIDQDPNAITVTTFTDRIEYYCTGSGNQTLKIPDTAYKIDYEIVAGRGGTGGTGIGHPGGSNPWPGGNPGYGQKLTGSLIASQFAGKTIILNVGQNGQDGNSFSGTGGGGGLQSGGSGGYNYSETSGTFTGSGGAGGGGSSGIRVNSNSVLVAGGGGGGAGGQWFEFTGTKEGQTSTNVYNQNDGKSASNGSTGGNSGASFNGAGGGGGGGYPGGAGGFAYISGNSIAGQGGYGGDGFADSTYVESYTLSTTTSNGYIKLIVYQRPSYIRIYNNQWREVSKVYVHDGTTWKQANQVHLKNNNIWKRVYGW